MKVLHLTLKKKWFDMIDSGEKLEEYREIKSYWISRLCAWGNAFDECRDFNAIQFKNGYQKNAPTILLKSEGIKIGYGQPRLGSRARQRIFCHQTWSDPSPNKIKR